MNDHDTPIDLLPDEVHLWLCFVDEQDSSTPEVSELAWLSADEHCRWQRFRFSRDRRRFLKARLLARQVLARCVGGAAVALRFEVDANGRPHLADQSEHVAGPVVFNLSHTQGLVVLAARRGAAVGVDTEASDRKVSNELARRVLTCAEQHTLSSLSMTMRPRRFLDLWTLKESYVKARGLGLQIPLDRFGFDLDRPDELALRFDPAFGDVPQRWQVWQCHPRGRHAVALCAERSVRGSAPLPLRLVTHEIEPLRWSRRVALPITRETPSEAASSRQ